MTRARSTTGVSPHAGNASTAAATAASASPAVPVGTRPIVSVVDGL